MHTKFRDDTL